MVLVGSMMSVSCLSFYKYEKARWSGRYNMIMEADKAIEACDITSREYRDIILSYGTYKRYIEAEYGTVDNFMRKFRLWSY